MKKVIYSLILLATNMNLLANSREFNQYIGQYKIIAIQEMQRTGIPASIKLAQGLLESNAGRSTLAIKANNHFGIKCGSKWKGKTIYRKDDDYKRGKLVKSCFRKYKSGKASYLAHSDFLAKDNKRYRFLFDLPATDYKQWAKGLKKAGYATSKTYASKLIKIIEQYHLYKYDHERANISHPKPLVLAKKTKKEYQYINDAKMVFAKEGDTPISIAKRWNTSAQRIVQYNEQITSILEKMKADTPVFLQQKRKRFRGRGRYHTVRTGESLYAISQLYGIRLKELYKRNKIPYGKEVMAGESIKIKGKSKKSPRLRINQPVVSSKKENTSTSTASTASVPSTVELSQNTHSNTSTTLYHTVAKGETLWRISQKYGMTVAALMKKNNLQTTTIHRGTKLKIK